MLYGYEEGRAPCTIHTDIRPMIEVNYSSWDQNYALEEKRAFGRMKVLILDVLVVIDNLNFGAEFLVDEGCLDTPRQFLGWSFDQFFDVVLD